MKKMFLMLAALLVIGNVSAQTVWGVRAGLSRPTINISGDGESFDIKGVFGFEAGPVLYHSLKNNFYINSGAMFSIKSFKFEFEDFSGEVFKETLSMYYIDVPLYLGYNFATSGKVSAYAQAGPFVGFKIGESSSENEESGLNSLNAGLAIMAGVNVNRFKFELGYQAGLANVLKTEDGEDYSAKLNSLFLGISYVF